MHGGGMQPQRRWVTVGGEGDRDTHSSWVMSSRPSSSCGSWYRTMGRLHSDCICTEQASAALSRQGCANPLPASHRPKATVCGPKPGILQPGGAGTPSKHPTAQERVPGKKVKCQGRAAALGPGTRSHQGVLGDSPRKGWSRRAPVPLAVGGWEQVEAAVPPPRQHPAGHPYPYGVCRGWAMETPGRMTPPRGAEGGG